MKSETYQSRHSSKILADLDRDRSAVENVCDTILTAGGRSFSVHKCILVVFSVFFKTMFSTAMRERYEMRANIQGVSGDTLEMILDFLYTCKITITSENVYDIMEAANYMEIPYLRNFCLQFLHNELEPRNCLSIRSYAKRYEYEGIVKKADEILKLEFESIIQADEFKHLELDDVTSMLKLEGKQVSSEESIYQAVIGWIKYDSTARAKHIGKLLNLIDIRRLSKSFLHEVVIKEGIITSSLECAQVLLQIAFTPTLAEPAVAAANVNINEELVVVKNNELYKYNTSSKMLTRMQKLKSTHLDATAVKYNDDIFVVSGRGTCSVEKLNLKEEPEWIEVAPITEIKWFAASVQCGDYIYTVGGAGVPKPTRASLRYHRRYNRWSKINDMKEMRRGHALASLQGKLYAIGGWGLNSVECYDTNQDADWSIVQPMKYERWQPSAVIMNDEIYAIGGYDQTNNKRLPSVERYNPTARAWKEIASLNIARSGHGACVVNGRIYVLGGYSEAGSCKVMEVYNPDMNIWEVECNIEHLKGVLMLVSTA